MTWEQWAAQNGVPAYAEQPSQAELELAKEQSSSSDPAVQAAINKRRLFREVQNQKNQYTDWAAGRGMTPGQMGFRDEKEQGQGVFTGWRQHWAQDQNTAAGQQFMRDPNYQGFVRAYGDPWIAFQNWKEFNRNLDNPRRGGMISQVSPGVYGTGGPNQTYHNQYGQQIDQSGQLLGGAGQGGQGVGGTGQGAGQGLTGTTGPQQYGQGYGPAAGPFQGAGGSVGGGLYGTGYNFSGGGEPGGDGPPPGPTGPTGTPWAPPAALSQSVSQSLGQGSGAGEFNYTTPAYTGPQAPVFNFERVPEFRAPRFNAPDSVTMQNDPGYKFRLGEGTQALEQSAAARGVLNSGNTLRGLNDYAQNFASQEYGNVFNRALQAYGTQYQGAKDEYAPRFAQWQGRFGAEQAGGLWGADAAMRRYMFGIDDDFRRQNMIYNGYGG
jgi:hypothetical protein